MHFNLYGEGEIWSYDHIGFEVALVARRCLQLTLPNPHSLLLASSATGGARNAPSLAGTAARFQILLFCPCKTKSIADAMLFVLHGEGEI